MQCHVRHFILIITKLIVRENVEKFLSSVLNIFSFQRNNSLFRDKQTLRVAIAINSTIAKNFPTPRAWEQRIIVRAFLSRTPIHFVHSLTAFPHQPHRLSMSCTAVWFTRVLTTYPR